MSNSEQQLKNIIEAAIMAAGEPLGLDKIQSLFVDDKEPPSRDAIKDVLQLIIDESSGRGVELKEVGSGYRFQAKQDYAHWVSRLWEEKPARYSRALLETLVLIAYKQPITRGEIEHVRGVAVSSNIIKTLQEREWVRVVGHRDVPGKPAIYATTRAFLDYFNIASLDELPTLAEIRDLDKINAELDLQPPNAEAATPANDNGADLSPGIDNVEGDADVVADSAQVDDTQTDNAVTENELIEDEGERGVTAVQESSGESLIEQQPLHAQATENDNAPSAIIDTPVLDETLVEAMMAEDTIADESGLDEPALDKSGLEEGLVEDDHAIVEPVLADTPNDSELDVQATDLDLEGVVEDTRAPDMVESDNEPVMEALATDTAESAISGANGGNEIDELALLDVVPGDEPSVISASKYLKNSAGLTDIELYEGDVSQLQEGDGEAVLPIKSQQKPSDKDPLDSDDGPISNEHVAELETVTEEADDDDYSLSDNVDSGYRG